MTSMALTRRSDRAVVRACLLVIAAIGSVQVGAALAKHLFPAAGPAGVVTIRLVTAAVAVTVLARPRVGALGMAQWRLLAAFGGVLAFMNLSFYGAIARIPLGVAVTIEFAGPLTVAVLGRRRARDLLWPALAGAGVLLLTGGGRALVDGDLDPLGVALALVAAAGWACYILLTQRIGATVPSMEGLAIALVIAAVVITPIGVARAGTALLDPMLLLLGAGVGVLSSALPWALEMVALRSLPTPTFGVLMSLEPAAAALAGLALLQEWLTPVQAVAIALTCLASAGATLAARTGPG